MARLASHLCILAVILVGLTPEASALVFELLTDTHKRRILFIRDCGRGKLDEGKACEEWETGFSAAGDYKTLAKTNYRYAGDPAVLSRLLRNNRIDEVWLFSGGGDLDAGIEVGRILRRERMQVRVPNHLTIRTARECGEIEVRCVSSCTVAFMGGAFRYLDEGATYEVHSASIVLRKVPPILQEMMAKGKFADFARFMQISERETARRLMTHFQNTLLLPVFPPRQMREDDRQFENWAERYAPRLPYTRQQADADRQRFAREGMAAAQDILMRMERDAMGWAIADLRRMDAAKQLGPRAKYAIDMVEEMYRVSIVETDRLSRETMYAMGYLTQDLDLDPQ